MRNMSAELGTWWQLNLGLGLHTASTFRADPRGIARQVISALMTVPCRESPTVQVPENDCDCEQHVKRSPNRNRNEAARRESRDLEKWIKLGRQSGLPHFESRPMARPAE